MIIHAIEVAEISSSSKVGIIGVGFVGDAILHSFTEHGIPTKCYDKYKNIGTLESLLDCEFIFLCLPTPFENNGYNTDAIHETCKLLKGYKGILIIKSTVEPDTCDKLKIYGIDIVHNPEFLSARTARQDFHNQKHIVLGGDKAHIVADFYKQYYTNAEISICTLSESATMKLFLNSFYAMKVQIFNEFHELCGAMDVNFNRVRDLMLKNGWINPMHTNVPGSDGKLSFGGACLPKDIQATNEFMKKLGTSNKVISACIEEHKIMRP